MSVIQFQLSTNKYTLTENIKLSHTHSMIIISFPFEDINKQQSLIKRHNKLHANTQNIYI